jgi:hypothetical protein
MRQFVELLEAQRESEAFSTYNELSQLSDQLDLVIKTNLPEVYDKNPSELRTYLSHMLNPVSPVIGASGETVGSRSAQARKFRMPGYPLVLISTDVFQEGEDLHTFCDSVIHYGLSGTPINIEQKTGRVDRVASRAQRRLLSIGAPEDIVDDNFIQVTFPFVRESIEVLQVRKLCSDINLFIEDLHEIVAREVGADDDNDLSSAMLDRSEIPPQILSRLRSPYMPRVDARSKLNNQEAFVKGQSLQSAREVSHIVLLLKKKFGSDVISEEFTDLKSANCKVSVGLRSARASGKMLLTATMQDTQFSTHGLKKLALLKLMQERSWHSFRRTCAVETAHRSFQLYFDAEMLIGDQHSTIRSELDKFFERFTDVHNPAKYAKPTSENIYNYWKSSESRTLKEYGQHSAELSCRDRKTHLELDIRIGEEQLRRKHRIRIYEADGRCVFIAKAASAEKVAQMSVDQIIRFTWQRNALIDIVEFMLNDKGELVGRAVHPVDGMDMDEFLYCVYILATATDRLEYLLQEPDIH